jgi:YaaC-like Protein
MPLNSSFGLSDSALAEAEQHNKYQSRFPSCRAGPIRSPFVYSPRRRRRWEQAAPSPHLHLGRRGCMPAGLSHTLELQWVVHACSHTRPQKVLHQERSPPFSVSTGEVMQHETWQQLLSFESRDLVSMWFKRIHGRDLNARRAKEITAAAKQAREFFRNSHAADNSVKPLLTFYGVASLARALTLILKRDGGEEGLTKGHGLETIDWSNQLSGDLSVGLAALNGLKIRTCSGLFSLGTTPKNPASGQL